MTQNLIMQGKLDVERMSSIMKRKMVRTGITAGCIAVLMSSAAFAMTKEELKTSYPTEYTAGTSSIYGSSLNQAQLDAVAQVVSDFVYNHITEGMNEEQKIREAHTYLFKNVSYAETWKENSANTAYGALVNHTAQCSGYARAFKALCDAMGIECYYVHADENAINPSHQWNIVKYNGQYYHMDVQVNAMGSGDDAIYLTASHPCTYNQSAYPQIASEDAPVQRYYDGNGSYANTTPLSEVYEFPGPENIWMDIVSEAAGPVGIVDYGICQAVQLPDDAGSIMILPESPYDESKYNLQMAVIPYKGKESKENGALCLALEGNYLTNFQYLKKGVAVNIDPLGLGRSSAEIAQYCRANDIFFELIIFDENAYRKFEQEHGAVTIQNLRDDIPGMVAWLTY